MAAMRCRECGRAESEKNPVKMHCKQGVIACDDTESCRKVLNKGRKLPAVCTEHGSEMMLLSDTMRNDAEEHVVHSCGGG
jgi:hypothetical protein